MRPKLEIQNIIHISIEIAGRVTQSDIIGAVFGQTEQVLVEDLDLRKLQKEGKLGRIEVETQYNDEGSIGTITIPSHMDNTNTVIIAAALETIEKIGPCKATAKVRDIENINGLKVREIVAHAKQVLQKFMEVSIDSQELIDKVNDEMRMEQAEKYGEEGVLCGPKIENYEELIFVEGGEELRNMLKNGIKNVVAFEDLSKRKTLTELGEKKEIIVFVDKGREYLVKRLMEFADIDNFSTPEDYKKIKEMGSKELHKALRGYVSAEQIGARRESSYNNYNAPRESMPQRRAPEQVRDERSPQAMPQATPGNFVASPRPPQQVNAQRPVQPTPERERCARVGRDRWNRGGDRGEMGGRGAPPRREYGRNDRDERRDFKPRYEVPEHISSLLKTKKGELKEGETYVLDKEFNVLGKLPVSELSSTLGSLNNVRALVYNGNVDNNLISVAEKNRIEFVAGNSCESTSRWVKIVV